MKKITLFFILVGFFSLSGCANAQNTKEKKQHAYEDTTSYEKENDSSTSYSTSSATESSANLSSASSTIESATNSSSLHPISSSEMNDALSSYTDDQIEYARIWLQLGANQEIDTLYAQKIPAGTPIIPTIKDSAVFPEDVIQLSGGRRVDGSVTYGSNHNGTIDVYNVPANLYWDFYTSAETSAKTPEEESQNVLSTTKRVSVATGNTSQIIKLIQLEKYTGDINLSTPNN